MKILQVITSLRFGGAEKLLVDIVPLLNKIDGISCDVLCLVDEDSPFREKLKEKGIRVIGLSKTISVYNPRLVLELKPFLSRYDIIHTHLTQPQFWVVLAKTLFCSKTPLITTEHNTHNKRREIGWMKPFDYFMYKKYEQIISISTATKNELINYLGLSNKMLVISNGINVEFFHDAFPICRQLIDGSLNDSDFIVTMVAAFREQKDQETVIKAMKYLPTDTKLLLVGDGKKKRQCQDLASSIGVKERVFFLGSREDVANILKMTDVVILSSHFEGFGLAAIEGMAAEKPIVVSDVPGLADIVKDVGLLFPVGNQEILANQILRLKEDADFLKDVAHSCYLKAQEYDIKVMVETLFELYKSVLTK